MSPETREAILVVLAVTPWLLFLALIAWSAAISRLEERAQRVEALREVVRAEFGQRKAA
jgi:hypothetical protein